MSTVSMQSGKSLHSAARVCFARGTLSGYGAIASSNVRDGFVFARALVCAIAESYSENETTRTRRVAERSDALVIAAWT